ncbi:MAG: hypothetical protein O2971_07980 [Proteobacteria bacterium]|nr:hypothetical protein [Pseudomonadota bacterium]
MNTSATLLGEIAQDQVFGSYYKVAKYLNVSTAYIYARRNDGHLSDSNLIKLAKAVGIDPMVLISAKNMNYARDEVSRAYWKSLFQKATADVKIA